jgi:2,4-dienoyl-CoA reductase-like NADH-dependent reductase (Old Yellow Enzyme family)
MTAGEVADVVARYGDVAAWAREAGYDGIQLGSANAKLLDQFLSPFWNRRTDAYGGSARDRARILGEIRAAVAEHAPPFMPHATWDEGIELARWCEEWGFDSVTPVEVSVFPDTTLSRGGVPTSIWRNKAMRDRLRTAAPKRAERSVIEAGYVVGGVGARFRPVWNRSRFDAVKRAVAIPVLAVGGIRTRAEAEAILDGGQADLVGIGRPFYAEPDLPRRILGGADGHGGHDRHEPTACVSSNLCVPAQMLGMKGACYNPDVVRVRSRRPGP